MINITSFEQLPYSEMFSDCVAYIYTAEIWWDGAGVDASIFWETADGNCKYLAIGTGETNEPIPAKIFREFDIRRQFFRELSENLIKAGVFEIKSPELLTSSLHSDSFFSMKLKSGDATSYIVKGRLSKDHAISMVEDILGESIRSVSKNKL